MNVGGMFIHQVTKVKIGEITTGISGKQWREITFFCQDKRGETESISVSVFPADGVELGSIVSVREGG